MAQTRETSTAHFEAGQTSRGHLTPESSIQGEYEAERPITATGYGRDDGLVHQAASLAAKRRAVFFIMGSSPPVPKFMSHLLMLVLHSAVISRRSHELEDKVRSVSKH